MMQQIMTKHSRLEQYGCSANYPESPHSRSHRPRLYIELNKQTQNMSRPNTHSGNTPARDMET